jgi:RNA polymerase sigma-70 factor (ECF subfamily)
LESQVTTFTDRQLIAKMIDGEVGGYEQLFKKYYAPLCGFAMKYVRDHEAAQDIVADVFYKLWNKRENMKRDVEIKPYLYVATKNTSLNYLKTSARNVDVEEETFGNYFVETRTAEDEIEFDDMKARLQETIAALPPKCREVFVLSRYEDLSYKEIAAKLGISVKTVENQMGKALKRLRIGLAKYIKVIIVLLSMNFFDF